MASIFNLSFDLTNNGRSATWYDSKTHIQPRVNYTVDTKPTSLSIVCKILETDVCLGVDNTKIIPQIAVGSFNHHFNLRIYFVKKDTGIKRNFTVQLTCSADDSFEDAILNVNYK